MKLFFKLLRLITNNYKPFHKKKELLIVLYHKVNDKPITFYPAVPTKVYQDTCLFLKKYYQLIHFSEVESYYASKPSKPAAIITFDDGMYDIIENALPFMEKHQLKFNINIDTEILETGLPQDFLRVYDILNNTSNISSYYDEKYCKTAVDINYIDPINTENKFTEILSNLSSDSKRDFALRMHEKLNMQSKKYSRVISKEELIDLSKNKLVEIGSHSHTHSVLTKVNENRLNYELNHSKIILEKAIDKAISIIAYPNGCSSEKIDELAQQIGYKYLLKTEDKTTKMDKKNNPASFYRINQYHQNTELALAHTFGIIQKIKKILRK